MTSRRVGLLAIALLSIAGCSSSEARSPNTEGPVTSGHVDSARTIEDELRLFRAALPPVTSLAGGAAHRDTLIVRFLAAVEHGDTASVRNMVLSRAEFAFLYYPVSPYSRPPMQQAPALTWFLLLQESQKGITRVFDRYSRRPLHYVSHACEASPRAEGSFRFWDRCAITYRDGGTTVIRRFFGSIVERDGHFKFMSYANDF
jgi:hypothetical protein